MSIVSCSLSFAWYLFSLSFFTCTFYVPLFFISCLCTWVCLYQFVCLYHFILFCSIDLFSLELSKIYYNNKAINGQQQLECNGTFIVEINWRPIFRSNWIYPFTQCQQICIFEWNVDDTIWLDINPKSFRDFCHFFDNYFKRNT